MMRTVTACNSAEEAYLAASRLESEGIEVLVRDAESHTMMRGVYSAALGGVRVDVPPQDWERARAILGLPVEQAGPLQCPHCGSGKVKVRGMNVMTALSISFGVRLPFASERADCLACGAALSLKEARRHLQSTD